ncbi:hypothetical protein [Chelatococcus reniformis]|uniref:Uncharacterized protein n=1 Tax=Chelatococcus reniformis TaxID=1494448 RepID=A0A916XA35_9HYPH|nr:hypothetical protein [Chelatococcus reniformis]GGC58360.1 hypothetical protein GCM10010994_16610 [Chelatococcus reniformis]
MSIEPAAVGMADADLMAHALADDEPARELAGATTPDGGAWPPDPSAAGPGEGPAQWLREVAEAHRQAEERAYHLEVQNRALMEMMQRAQPQAAAQPPDQQGTGAGADAAPAPPNDPEGGVGSQLGGVVDALLQQREYYSRRDAERTHGGDKVSQAYEALQQMIGAGAMDGPAVVSALRQSMDPYGEIMDWYEEHLEHADPELAEQRAMERLLADPARRERLMALLGGATPGAAPAGANSVVKLPPSLNRATSASSDRAGSGGDMSDAALFAYATQS